MSNTERQRRFRERNPGYYGRLHRKHNAEVDQLCAQQAALAVREEAIVVAQAEVPLPVQVPLPVAEQTSTLTGLLLLLQIRALSLVAKRRVR